MGFAFALHEGSSKIKLLIMQILTALLLLLHSMHSHASQSAVIQHTKLR